MVFGSFAGPLIRGNVIGSIRAAFPSDDARRSALRRCREMDAEFSRFLQRDRDVCYRAMLHQPAEAAADRVDQQRNGWIGDGIAAG
jgi:hypothetical protein